MATVFVGIPTLNRPEYVRDAIASVLAQTFTDVRVLVGDNVSDAGVADAVEAHVRGLGDARIRFQRQERNEGEYGQGRLFMREVREEYFVMLHDDDVLEPTCIERAVACLNSDASLACFVANPYLMDAGRVVSRELTREYQTARGRDGCPEGPIDMLETLFGLPPRGVDRTRAVEGGFIPMSGTCFRTSALRASGFADPGRVGNYPFEFDVLIRLGEAGARAWFCPEELVGFRQHTGSMTTYIRITENPLVVDRMIDLLGRRRFSGKVERRRRVYLSRFLRAAALIAARRGESGAARRLLLRAVRENPRSARAWALAPGLTLAPRLIRAAMPPLPEALAGPRLKSDAAPMVEGTK